jgi:signal transduction histidine kinase/GAF domain-containing protein
MAEGGPIDKPTIAGRSPLRAGLRAAARSEGDHERRAAPRSDEFLELVAYLSSRFVNLAGAEVEREVEAALQRVLVFFGLDRAALLKVDADRHFAQVILRLKSSDAPEPLRFGRSEPVPWLYNAVVDRGETVAIASLDDLPDEASVDRGILRQHGIKSFLLIPLTGSDSVDYVLTLGSERQECAWTAAHGARLRLLGEVFAGAMKRKRLEEGQRDALRFEHVTADILSRFARTDPEQLDDQIRLALQELLAFAQVDRFGLFRVDADSDWVHLTHMANAEGAPATALSYDLAKAAPWLHDRMMRAKEPFSFESLDDFPPEAAPDRKLVESRGTRSGLYIPLQVDGQVRWILAGVRSRVQQPWHAQYVERLTTLGEVIVSAINRKAMIAERLRSESVLAEAQRIANLGSWEWDIASDRVTTSEQCDRIQGFPIKCFADFIGAVHPHDREAVRRQVERDMSPPYARGTLEYRIVRPDGPERHVRDVYELVPGSDGRPSRVIGTVQDITERTLMRQRLQSAQQFAQATLSAFHKSLCVIDAAGVVVEVSDGWPAFAQASGTEPLVTGANFFLVTGRTQGPKAAQARNLADGVRAVVAGRQDEFSMETAYDTPAGPRFFHTKINHFELEGARYAAVSHEEITLRRNAELELENLRAQHWHSERVARTGLLIGSLAHELSQPLTAILSNAQAGLRFLARDEPDLLEIGAILRDIASDDKRAGEIIQSLRVMLRRQQSERQLIDLAALAGEVTTLLKSELVGRQIELESDCAAGCLAQANRAQIQQVLLNLMMNGIEAMTSRPPWQRRMRVEVRGAAHGEVHVSVNDSGCGISQEKFKTVFDAFWTTKSSGTGMGLAISRSIIESHGGRIWVDSREGEGATFYVSLPAAAGAKLSVADSARGHLEAK